MKKNFFRTILFFESVKQNWNIKLLLLTFFLNLNCCNTNELEKKIFDYINSKANLPHELNQLIINYLRTPFVYLRTIKSLGNEKIFNTYKFKRYIKFHDDNTIKAYVATSIKCLTAEYAIINIDGTILFNYKFEHDLSPIDYIQFTKKCTLHNSSFQASCIGKEIQIKHKSTLQNTIMCPGVQSICYIEKNLLASATKDEIFVWDLNNINQIKLIQILNLPKYSSSNDEVFILNIAASNDGQFLAASFSNADIVIWKRSNFDIQY